MIKKLLLSAAALTTLLSTAQNLKVDGISTIETKKLTRVEAPSANAANKVSSAAVVDTLGYFFNKHYYRNPSPSNLSFITVKNAAVVTGSTEIAGFGGIYKNSGNLAVTGAEAVISRQANATSTSVPVGLFLYNAPSGTISGAPIASVQVAATGTAPIFAGGNFATPAIVTGDYAIIAKNISAAPQDTIRLWINNALTPASSSTNNAAKYGEGFGVVGVGTPMIFIATTGAFGAGTDYEGLVAARVAYSVTTSAAVPTGTLCTNVSNQFTNTSSPWIGHRQYNMNQFLVSLAPFSFTGTPAPNPVYSWAFGDAAPSLTTTGTTTLVAKTYTAAGSFNGTLTATILKMSDSGFSVSDNGTFSKTVSTCVGIYTNELNANVALYPNPANGIAKLVNLEGTNTITVYNFLGQLVYTTTSSTDNVTIDLRNQAVGTYFVKIVSANNHSKTLKLINN